MSKGFGYAIAGLSVISTLFLMYGALGSIQDESLEAFAWLKGTTGGTDLYLGLRGYYSNDVFVAFTSCDAGGGACEKCRGSGLITLCLVAIAAFLSLICSGCAVINAMGTNDMLVKVITGLTFIIMGTSAAALAVFSICSNKVMDDIKTADYYAGWSLVLIGGAFQLFAFVLALMFSGATKSSDAVKPTGVLPK